MRVEVVDIKEMTREFCVLFILHEAQLQILQTRFRIRRTMHNKTSLQELFPIPQTMASRFLGSVFTRAIGGRSVAVGVSLLAPSTRKHPRS